jgi:tetratricopeptide (TPR) repeat protein
MAPALFPLGHGGSGFYAILRASVRVKGVLGEGVLPSVLRELYVGRKTGVLRFTEGAARRTIQFVKGSIVNAASEAPEEHLGEVLVRLGRLTRADLDRADEAMRREHKRLGAVLMELGVFDRDQLEDALALHAHEILIRIFEASSEGTYEFEPAESEVAQGEFTLKLSTGEIILDAVRRVRDPDVVRYALGDIDRVLALSTDPLLRFQRITLSPSDGYILSRIDGTLSAREVMRMLALPAEDVQRSLFGLLCTGIVEPAAGPPKAPAKAVRLRRRPEARPEPAPPPPAAPLPPAAPEPSADTQAKRREIAETYETLKARSHFEVLGIERAATEAQVKEAYFRLAKRFHPDTHHDANMADLRDKLESVFIRLGEAYEVLRNPRSRAAYESELASRSPRPRAATARASAAADRPAAPAAAPPPAVPALDPAVAAQSVRRAEKLMEQEKYWDAIQLLEAAVPALEGKPKQRARLNLARAYTKNPNWVRQAEETLHEVVKDDPKNLDAYLALGRLYKAGGLRNRSVGMFRKVLELKPENEEAQAELAALGPEPETTESRGFLKKLFGRG